LRQVELVVVNSMSVNVVNNPAAPVLRNAILPEEMLDPEDVGISPEDTAKILNVTVATLATWRSQGRGPRFRKPGRAVEYTPRFIREYQQSRTFTPEPASARRLRRALAAESASK
jgi:hypothetical protein